MKLGLETELDHGLPMDIQACQYHSRGDHDDHDDQRDDLATKNTDISRLCGGFCPTRRAVASTEVLDFHGAVRRHLLLLLWQRIFLV